MNDESLSPPDAGASLLALLSARMRRWEHTGFDDLLADEGQGFARPDEALVRHAVRAQRALSRFADAPFAASASSTLAQRTARWIWSQNQFLALDDAALDALAGVYRAGFSTLGRAANDRTPWRETQAERVLEALFAEHRARLRSFVRAHFGARPAQVRCACYAPALQLAVLGLSASSPAGPLLDVGCGDGALVHALRRAGIDARGFDRAHEAGASRGDEGVVSRGDWLAYDYGRARWGTVLSHLGASLHFLHAHHTPGAHETARAYAQLWMRIVRSLAPGGVFAYAPALPFFEPLLARAGYALRHVPLDGSLATALARHRAGTAVEFSVSTYATQVVGARG